SSNSITLLPSISSSFLFFFTDTASPQIYTLSLHDALPIYQGRHAPLFHRHPQRGRGRRRRPARGAAEGARNDGRQARRGDPFRRDRKSTRLNSSHQIISYAVFCLKKKKKNNHTTYKK